MLRGRLIGKVALLAAALVLWATGGEFAGIGAILAVVSFIVVVLALANVGTTGSASAPSSPGRSSWLVRCTSCGTEWRLTLSEAAAAALVCKKCGSAIDVPGQRYPEWATHAQCRQCGTSWKLTADEARLDHLTCAKCGALMSRGA